LKDLSSSFDILKKKFPGYEDRPEQREMAGEILDSFMEGKNLLIEAGTGVGKSLTVLMQ
jgi:Rad3-related DNA helicase